MKRFIVFCGDTYYASGGMYDFLESFDTLEEALMAALKQDDDWYHIYDCETKKVLDKSDIEPYHVPWRRKGKNNESIFT